MGNIRTQPKIANVGNIAMMANQNRFFLDTLFFPL